MNFVVDFLLAPLFAGLFQHRHQLLGLFAECPYLGFVPPSQPLLSLLTTAGPTQRLTLRPGPCETSFDMFLDHGAFKFCENTHHLEHRLAGGGGRVDACRVEFTQEGDQVPKRAPQPVDGPGHDQIELAARGVWQHPFVDVSHNDCARTLFLLRPFVGQQATLYPNPDSIYLSQVPMKVA